MSSLKTALHTGTSLKTCTKPVFVAKRNKLTPP